MCVVCGWFSQWSCEFEPEVGCLENKIKKKKMNNPTLMNGISRKKVQKMEGGIVKEIIQENFQMLKDTCF